MDKTSSYTDLSVISDNGYKLAALISSGSYSNIFYYEFHDEVDPSGIWNCLEGLDEFQKRSSEFYSIFVSEGYVDGFPAVINVALNVNNEWFIARDCGSNYYLGFGPGGILKLRKACFERKITAFALEDSFEDWIKEKFGKPRKSRQNDQKNVDALQFTKLIKALQFLTVDMQRRPDQFQGLNEENIRDRMLTPLNVAFKSRGHAESKNRKGKTDICVRTKDGLNEHIFELKIWGGIKTLIDAVEQLSGYLSWHNNYCGILMFSYNSNFTSVLDEVEKYLQSSHNFNKREKIMNNEFRFQLGLQTDNKKNIEVHLVLINLKA